MNGLQISTDYILCQSHKNSAEVVVSFQHGRGGSSCSSHQDRNGLGPGGFMSIRIDFAFANKIVDL